MFKWINNWFWRIYHKRRKNKFTPYRVKANIENIKAIPLGALGSVFGSNVLTKNYERLVLDLSEDESPTHSIIYIGNGHKIAEADVFYSLNRLERYSGKRVVFHYFRDMEVEELEEVKRRIYYCIDKKLVYDFTGYAGFVSRIDPSFSKKLKWLKASDTTFFCSDANVVIYHGDHDNTDNEIKRWTLLRNISVIYEANGNCPADIFVFLEQLYEMMPDKIGRIELIPE